MLSAISKRGSWITLGIFSIALAVSAFSASQADAANDRENRSRRASWGYAGLGSEVGNTSQVESDHDIETMIDDLTAQGHSDDDIAAQITQMFGVAVDPL